MKCIQPSQNRVYNSRNSKGIAFLIVGLSHLCEYKFKHTFLDILNPICNCGKDIETSSHYLLYCPDYLQEKVILLNTFSYIVPNISDLNNPKLTEILLYSKRNVDDISNTTMLDGTINFLKWYSGLPKKLFYLLQWKPIKSNEKCFLFYLKTSFRSQDTSTFVLIGKIRWFLKIMTSQICQQTIKILILPSFSQSKGNQTMKFGQESNTTREIFF